MRRLAHGRELRADELQARELYIVQPPGSAALVPMILSYINTLTQVLRFYSREQGWVIEYEYDRDGEIYDEHGRPLHVYEKQNRPFCGQRKAGQ